MRNKSWRDSEKGRGRGSRSSKGGRAATPRGERGYKADLDKLFDHGEVPDRFKDLVAGLGGTSSSKDAARQKLIRAARSAEGEEFLNLIEEIHTNSTLPDDEELMVRALSHPNEDVVRGVLTRLIDLDGRRPVRKRQIIAIRLKTIREIAESSDTIDLVDMLEERL